MKKGFTDKCNCYDLGLVYVPSHRPAAHKIAALCDGVKIHGYRPAFANYNSKGEIERLQLTKIPSEQGRKRAADIPPDIVEEMHSHWCSLVLNENEYSKAKSCKKQNLVIKQTNGRFWNKQKKYGRYYQNGSEADYWRMALRLGKDFVATDGKHSLVKFFEKYNFVPGRQLHSCVKFVEDLEKFVGVRVHCNFNKAKHYRYMNEFHILFDLKGNMMDFILVPQHLKYKPDDKFCLENLALRAKDPEFPNVIERPVEWTAAGSEQEDPLKRDGETVTKPEEQLCSDWMAGNCKRNVCTFLHSVAQAPHGRETWKNPAHITRPEDAHKRQQSRSDVDTVKEPFHAQTSEQKDPPERKGGTVQMIKNLCIDWADGKCSRKVCRFSHSKPPACSLWAEAGSCPRRGICRFLHSIDEDCSDWMAGNCKRNVCIFLHSKAQAPHGRETWKNPAHITRPEDAHKRQQSRSDVDTVKEPCHAQTSEQKDPPERKGGTVQMFKNLCRDWAGGKCSRKVCRFLHSKPPACSLWAEAGSCSRRGICRFLHSIDEDCSDWMAGNCKRNVCKFLHSKAQAPHGRETWKNPVHITRPEDAHKRQQSRSDVDTVKEPCYAQTGEQKDPPERKGGTVKKPEIQLHSEERSIVERTGAKKRKRKRTSSVDDEK